MLTYYHMSIDKDFLIRLVQAHGPRKLMPTWTGTKKQAIEMIRADARQAWVIGTCSAQDEKGDCSGHPRTCDLE